MSETLKVLKQSLEGMTVTEVSVDEDDRKVRLCIETETSKIVLYLDNGLENSAFIVKQEEKNGET